MNETYRFVKYGMKVIAPPDLVPRHFGGGLGEDLSHPHDAWIATAIVMPLHLLFEPLHSEWDIQDGNGKVAGRKLRGTAVNNRNSIGSNNEVRHRGESERRDFRAPRDPELIQKYGIESARSWRGKKSHVTCRDESLPGE